MVQQLQDNELNLTIKVANISDVVVQSVTTVDTFAREKEVIIRIQDDEAHEVRVVRPAAERLLQGTFALCWH